jgi:hypothetical protein
MSGLTGPNTRGFNLSMLRVHPCVLFLVGAWCFTCVNGCAIRPKPVMPRVTMLDKPIRGEEAKAELGDTIVVKGKILSFPGLRLLEDFTISNWRGTGELKAGILKAELEDSDWTYYHSPTPWVDRNNLAGTRLLDGGLTQLKTNANQFRAWYSMNGTLIRGDIPLKPTTASVDVTEILPNSFQQELIYNGRSGQTLKFLYREISDNYLRTAFTQDVQYDLRDGNVVGFKGSRIEIIEANNQFIRYRVQTSFPARP